MSLVIALVIVCAILYVMNDYEMQNLKRGKHELSKRNSDKTSKAK